MKAGKIAIIIVSVVLVLLIIACFIGANILYTVALDPTSDKTKVFNADHNSMDNGEDHEKRMEEYQKKQEKTDAWFQSVTHNDVYMTSDDGLKLYANEITNEANSNLWLIACHGYLSNSSQMLGNTIPFYDMGFNLLLPDARGHGNSEGDYIGMGWDERLDIVGWINTIVKEHPDAQIVLYGVSMGGGTVMMVSGEEMPSNVKAIVEDCGYSSVWDELAYQLKAIFKIPSFPMMNFSSLVTKIKAGYWLGEASAVKQVEKSVTPMLFIHGTDDTFVPFEMLDVVYNAATCPKEKLVAQGAGHGGASGVLGDEYWSTIEQFIFTYID